MNEWINFSGHPLLSIDIISKNQYLINKYPVMKLFTPKKFS